MKIAGTKTEQGPKHGWYEWRERRNRAIQKPRRNAAALKLTQPKEKRDER